MKRPEIDQYLYAIKGQKTAYIEALEKYCDWLEDGQLTIEVIEHADKLEQQIKELKAFKDSIEKTVHPRHWKEQR